ncbi:hypothetical protein CTA2_2725, partial [Colletotrichum tanaceti]
MASSVVMLSYAFWVTGCEDIWEPRQCRCPMTCTLDKAQRGVGPWRVVVVNGDAHVVVLLRRADLPRLAHRAPLVDGPRQGPRPSTTRASQLGRRAEAGGRLREVEREPGRGGGGEERASSALGTSSRPSPRSRRCLLGLPAYFGFGVYSLVDEPGARALRDGGGRAARGGRAGLQPAGAAIFLLLIPFMGLFESYARHSKAIQESEAKELDSCPSEGSW